MTINYEILCQQTVELCVEVGQFILKSGQQSEVEKKNLLQIEQKGSHNYVTAIDKAAEKKLIDALSILLPESSFIAEEGTVETEDKDFKWIIDPLDGTTNFIHGLSPFCVSVGLMYKTEMVLGVIYEPRLNEAFYAWQGSKAYLNGNEIRVSSTKLLDNSLLATGFPYTDYGRLDNYLELFKWCMKNTRGVRRLGSAAMDLAYVACGRVDGFFEYGLSPWDVAAGVFIVQQAGGKVTDFKGGNDYIFGKELVAVNAYLHDEFAKIVSEFMG